MQGLWANITKVPQNNSIQTTLPAIKIFNTFFCLWKQVNLTVLSIFRISSDLIMLNITGKLKIKCILSIISAMTAIAVKIILWSQLPTTTKKLTPLKRLSKKYSVTFIHSLPLSPWSQSGTLGNRAFWVSSSCSSLDLCCLDYPRFCSLDRPL